MPTHDEATVVGGGIRRGLRGVRREERERAMSNGCRSICLLPLVAGALALTATNVAAAQTAPACPTMRTVTVGVSVAPPNVVHTAPYVAKELGFFAKRCIDANIVQFEGGQSATANAA